MCEVSRSSSRLSRSMAGSPVEGNLHKRYGRKLRSTFGSHGSLNRRVGERRGGRHYQMSIKDRPFHSERERNMPLFYITTSIFR